MTEVVIFGGTTEGRKLAELCVSMAINTCVCVVSDYGEQLLPQSDWLTVHTGPMDAAEMEQLLRECGAKLIFDATHPYAAAASENIGIACRNIGIAGVRVLREESAAGKAESELWVDTIEAAVACLEQDAKPVLVTTGSRELHKYKALKECRERIYARVLASHEGLEACEALGLSGSHIIAMQGPFGRRLNEALLEQIGAGWLVTKESGPQGGFVEKLEAARALGVRTIVIGRPRREEGISLADAGRRIAALRKTSQRRASLIGIGMGSAGLLTAEAVAAIRDSDALIGAPRMVAEVREMNAQVPVGAVYLPADVCAWLREHPQVRRAAILFSGDTGFYSGAPAVAAALAAEELAEAETEAESQWQVRMLPGISTVSYLCARLNTGWEDVSLCSLHGRDCELEEQVLNHTRVFCLLGGREPVRELCGRLSRIADVKLRLTIGEWLSYPQERIISGTPEELMEMEFGGFCAALIERI